MIKTMISRIGVISRYIKLENEEHLVGLVCVDSTLGYFSCVCVRFNLKSKFQAGNCQRCVCVGVGVGVCVRFNLTFMVAG